MNAFAVVAMAHSQEFEARDSRGNEIHLLACEACPQGLRPERFCPDLGIRAPEGRKVPVGRPPGGGRPAHEFDCCPAYYRRDPRRWPALPFAVGNRHPWEIAAEVSADVERGTFRLSDLPGKLYDLVMILRIELGRRASWPTQKDHGG